MKDKKEIELKKEILILKKFFKLINFDFYDRLLDYYIKNSLINKFKMPENDYKKNIKKIINSMCPFEQKMNDKNLKLFNFYYNDVLYKNTFFKEKLPEIFQSISNEYNAEKSLRLKINLLFVIFKFKQEELNIYLIQRKNLIGI